MDRSLPDPFDLGPPDPTDSQTTLVADATRRSFLRGVIAAGLLPVLPSAAAPMMDMDRERFAHLRLTREPLHFRVDDGGALELANWLPEADRFSAYAVEPWEVDRAHDGFPDLLDRIEALRSEVWWTLHDLAAVADDDSDDDSDGDTATVARLVDSLTPSRWAALQAHLLDWFSGDVTLEERDGPDIVRPVDGRQWALALFRDRAPDAFSAECLTEAFRITVVEGDHPGSTYQAAEIGVSVDEANRIARRLDLPVTFAAEDW